MPITIPYEEKYKGAPWREEREVYPVPEFWQPEEQMRYKPPTHWEGYEPYYRTPTPESERERAGREGRMRETPTPPGPTWGVYELTGPAKLPEFDIKAETAIQEFINKYAESELRIPRDFGEWADEQKAMWAEQNKPYGGAIFNTETGEQIPWVEARELVKTTPDLSVTVVYPLGGGQAGRVTQLLREIAMSAEEWEQWERQEMVTGMGAPGVALGETYTRAMAKESDIAERYAGRIREALEAGVSAEELNRMRDELSSEFYRLSQEDEDYAAFLSRPEFHMKEEGIGILRERMGEALTKAMADIPDELMLRYEHAVMGPEERPKIEDTLRVYGIWVSAGYPYITPLSSAQIRRLPPAIVALIKRYLSEKGLSWEDYLAISEPAKTVPEEWGERIPTRWGVPTQW